MRKPSSSYPTYLALNTVEHNSIRADQKQQVINKWKSVHAGSDERCSEMVKKWIADEKYVFVKWDVMTFHNNNIWQWGSDTHMPSLYYKYDYCDNCDCYALVFTFTFMP